MTDTMVNIAVLGASDNPARYSYLALKELDKRGYKNLFPIHPQKEEIQGIKVYPGLEKLPVRVHTLSLYMGPERLNQVVDAMIKARPKRVIFNPGTESAPVKEKLENNGIDCSYDCTLVMLRTKSF